MPLSREVVASSYVNTGARPFIQKRLTNCVYAGTSVAGTVAKDKALSVQVGNKHRPAVVGSQEVRRARGCWGRTPPRASATVGSSPDLPRCETFSAQAR